MKAYEFSVRLEVHKKTGRLVSAYLQIRRGKSARTLEFADGSAFANYDRSGLLLGIELLGPCEIAVLDKIAKQEPKETKAFFRNMIPREMALCA